MNVAKASAEIVVLPGVTSSSNRLGYSPDSVKITNNLRSFVYFILNNTNKTVIKNESQNISFRFFVSSSVQFLRVEYRKNQWVSLRLSRTD
jgi:hypothetical protein